LQVSLCGRRKSKIECIFFEEIALLIYMKNLLKLGCRLTPDSRRIVADQISARRLGRVGYRFDAVLDEGKGG
jgi:hypothetical protein